MAPKALLMLQPLISIFHLPWASFCSSEAWNLLYFRTWGVFCSISLNSLPLSPYSLSLSPALSLSFSNVLLNWIFAWPRSLSSFNILHITYGLPRWSSGKETAFQYIKLRRRGFSPQVGTMMWSRNGNPLQYSCWENPTDRGACWATVHGVASSWTWLNTHTHTHTHTHSINIK